MEEMIARPEMEKERPASARLNPSKNQPVKSELPVLTLAHKICFQPKILWKTAHTTFSQFDLQYKVLQLLVKLIETLSKLRSLKILSVIRNILMGMQSL